jgi:hypothetical protein
MNVYLSSLQDSCVFETVFNTTQFDPEDGGSTFLPKQQDQQFGTSSVCGFFHRKRWV